MSNDTHLKRRGKYFWYCRRVPKDLQALLGKDRIEESLKTGDVQHARMLRDERNAELSRLAYNSTSSKRQEYNTALLEFEHYSAQDYQHGKYIDFPLTPSDLRRMGSHTEADALETLRGNKDIAKKYGLALSEAVDLVLERKANSVSDDTLRRYNYSAETFSKFLLKEADDVLLTELNRPIVHKFVRHLEASKAKRSTIQGHLSRLKTVWQQASNIGHVSADNPFEKQEIIVPDSRLDSKTQLFEDHELLQLIDLINIEPQEFKLIIKILAYTGARPAEICNLRVSDVVEHDGVIVLNIIKGKTLAASRYIPLSNELVRDISDYTKKLHPNEPLFRMSAKDIGRKFSRLKSRVIPNGERKVLYSLRVHFATAAQRANIREDIAAQIVGHSNAKTLTFGYYSKGYEVSALKENYDKIAKYIKERWKVEIQV